MSFSRRRVAAITVKELRDYRHNRFVIATMAFLPVLFIALPIVQLLSPRRRRPAPSSTRGSAYRCCTCC